MSSSQMEHRRQADLEKQRKRAQEEYERQKAALIAETEKARPSANRFVGQTTTVEDSLRKSTVGLVHLEEFQQRREEIEEAKARAAARTDELKEEKKIKKRKKLAKAKLSFVGDAGDGEEELSDGQGDREREEQERREREELRKEWLQRQEEIKNEEIEITYSYWDGSGHRKSVVCKKGDTISTFLEKCRSQFPELRGVSVDNLMYIKARGKSGPLFNFDVHDDVRLLADATVEKNESHAGKVVERSWYNRSKHIFPASRWEVFDPEKDYGKYTIA
ncbi:hypothetical protein Clacol_006856 [Clathrus columnatus]|uniref:FAM50A/XAP5 C-terminal domain-containing protein n=1 Tax=Clathrus columnatus TaxID=1419009 RepID=A0AAV5AIV3_9AGAM|nr:hypothetical protein Clacol_006856 [Clathrus columnatus]